MPAEKGVVDQTLSIESTLADHEFIRMVDADVMEGLAFFQQGRDNGVKALQLCFRDGETRSGFRTNLRVALLCRTGPVESFL